MSNAVCCFFISKLIQIQVVHDQNIYEHGQVKITHIHIDVSSVSLFACNHAGSHFIWYNYPYNKIYSMYTLPSDRGWLIVGMKRSIRRIFPQDIVYFRREYFDFISVDVKLGTPVLFVECKIHVFQFISVCEMSVSMIIVLALRKDTS